MAMRAKRTVSSPVWGRCGLLGSITRSDWVFRESLGLLHPSRVALLCTGLTACNGSLRGKSKKPDPIVRIETIEIVEKPVERVVEKFVEQEVVVDCDTTIFALLSDVTFKFDSYQLTEASKEELDKAAIILLQAYRQTLPHHRLYRCTR